MPGDCFITISISKEVVPEMVPLLVLQHQIPNFRIKLEKCHKETTHIPSIHLSLSVSIESVDVWILVCADCFFSAATTAFLVVEWHILPDPKLNVALLI